MHCSPLVASDQQSNSYTIVMCTARSVLYALRAPAPVNRLDFHVRYSKIFTKLYFPATTTVNLAYNDCGYNDNS